MSSNRPETSAPLPSSEPTTFTPSTDRSSPFIGAASHIPNVFDFVVSTHRARDNTKTWIPSEFLQSEAVDSSVLLGFGASFTVTRQTLPPGPETLVEKQNMGSWLVEKIRKPPKRPRFIVYKSARVAFLENGYPRTPRDRRALQSVLTEFYALLHPPIRSHPNIIDLIDIAWASNPVNPNHRLPVLVVEYGDRGTLADVQRQGPRLLNSVKQDLCLGIAKGLQALHEQDILHGDIKPGNIIICSHKEKGMIAKLADFGFAVIDPVGSSEVVIGGTRIWRAPESFAPVAASKLKYTDVFSFGLVAWSIAVDGKSPFDLLLGSQFQGEERLRQIDWLKEEDRIFTMSPLENWIQKWDLLRRTMGLSARLDSQSLTGPDSGPTQSRTVPNITQIIAWFRQQVFFRELETIFRLTLRSNPDNRDLPAVIKRLQTSGSNPQLAKGLARIESGSRLSSSSQSTTITYAVTNLSSQNRHFTIRNNSSIPGVTREVGVDQKQQYTLANNGEPSSAGQPEEPKAHSRIAWASVGYKAHVHSWQQFRDFEPSIQAFLVRSFFDSSHGPDQFFLGVCFLNGYGVPVDLDKGLQSIARAASNGHAISRANSYRLYKACKKQIPSNTPILKYLKEQALRGSRMALRDLLDLDHEQGKYLRDILRFGYGGVGSGWFLDDQWLYGLTQSTLMSKDFAISDMRLSELSPDLVVNSRGDHLIHAAAAVGAARLVQELLFKGRVDVNQRNARGETPLLCACRSGHPGIVKCLLDAGARASIPAANGETPLHWLRSFNEEVIQVEVLGEDLVERGRADVDAFTTEPVCHSLFPGSIDVDFQRQGTPLMWAVHDNRPRLVAFLLERGADPNWRYEKSGTSVIETAAYYHHTECLQLMIEHFERIVDTPMTTTGTRDLRHAIFYGPLIFMAVHAADRFSMILRNGHDYRHQLECTLSLLQQKTRLINFNNSLGEKESLLHLAASGAHDEACEVILKLSWLADQINKPAGRAGRTPLLESIRWNRAGLFQLLRQHGADPTLRCPSPWNISHNTEIWTALHLFADQGHNDETNLTILDELIAGGLLVDGDSNDCMETALHIAIRRNAFCLANRLLQHGALVDALCRQSALFVSPYLLTGLGHLIALNGRHSFPALRYALKVGAEFIVAPAQGLTALHLCALMPKDFCYANGHMLEREGFDMETNQAIAGELLAWFHQQEQINRACSGTAKTALHLAVEMGNIGVVEELVRAGADQKVVCKNGETPIELGTRIWTNSMLLDQLLQWLE